jgi:UDP-N-acetylmuramoyl-tripeptide--D-alanyl-D-alanine ligase
METTLDDLAAATGGRVVGGGVTVSGVAIDTRELVAGSLFVALVAERDGHDFLVDAARAGAAAALVSDPAGLPEALPAVVVDDTQVALERIGRAARDRLPDRLVAITGSVGKTSAKDLTAAAIAGGLSVHASARSFNNEIGVPVTLANAPSGVEAVVVEMGARGHTHVADLCAIARPTVGVVTAVSRVHTEFFGTIDDVARAKGELVEALPVDGTAVLNADDPKVAAMADRSGARVLTYGVSQGAVRAVDITLDDLLRPTFTLVSPWGRAPVRLGVAGEHNALNAAGAAAAALALGVPLDVVAEGLHEAELSPWRMEVVRTASGAVVINDAYNANPASVQVALEALVTVPADRRIAVLGLMAELGRDSPAEHRAIGELARGLDIEVVAVASPDYGGTDVDDVDVAVAHLGTLGPGDAVLVKGSRVAGLERLAQVLVAEG